MKKEGNCRKKEIAERTKERKKERKKKERKKERKKENKYFAVILLLCVCKLDLNLNCGPVTNLLKRNGTGAEQEGIKYATIGGRS